MKFVTIHLLNNLTVSTEGLASGSSSGSISSSSVELAPPTFYQRCIIMLQLVRKLLSELQKEIPLCMLIQIPKGVEPGQDFFLRQI